MNALNVKAVRLLVLTWYTGKAREKARTAFDLLEASIAQGSWVPKASRTVVATLGKSNVAEKFAREHVSIQHDLHMLLMYGWACKYAQKIDLAAAHASNNTNNVDAAAFAETYLADFAAVREAIERLDATRPAPVFTQLGASPTITTTLKDLGLDANVTSMRVCPIEWVTLTRKNPKTGKDVYVKIGYLKWPKGIVHNASRFHYYNRQCESCGHAIKNPFNWVPMIVDNAAGVPHSLWVGRDCAETLFGVKVKGEVELAEGPGAAPVGTASAI